MKKNHIFLIGFMGTGKSTISARMCSEYKMTPLEMDEQIEKNEGKSISDIFAGEGEEYFRNLETELLKSLAEKENLIVSCGGGTAMRECNVQEMRRQGIIVLLNALPSTVYERVKKSHNRPLLENNMNEAYIQSLMEKRREGYEAAADFCVDTDGRTAGDISREIMDRISHISEEKRRLL